MKERSYKEMKMNGARHYSELVKMCADVRARWHFRRRPYTVYKLSEQARRLIRAQGMQIEHKSVEEYLQEKGRLRGDVIGG
ncbi:MAG: hypothetical protein MSA90_18620 [Faecalicatena sp.]|uniref:hypothetical protein n=1 Tax=Faecalicatena sp. TaxID=2005360 RepID=UPI002583B1F8|nr:hypothetical protein [Faecalicatena sp.]MCI6467463.1 hypothetical protein [Faecalicatena sp.]MDY5618163.1 hypothetical protein [Lachnospiraceae bacterium]